MSDFEALREAARAFSSELDSNFELVAEVDPRLSKKVASYDSSFSVLEDRLEGIEVMLEHLLMDEPESD